MLSFMPYANWEAIVIVLIVFIWVQHRNDAKVELANDEQSKLKEQLEELSEKVRLFEYVIQEQKIEEQYELSDKRHPEMYTNERLPLIGKPARGGWNSNYKPKPEFEEQIELSRKIYVTEMRLSTSWSLYRTHG